MATDEGARRCADGRAGASGEDSGERPRGCGLAWATPSSGSLIEQE